MKCFIHPRDDAVAICKICGKAMCPNCLITLAGDSYCKSCVEAGRVQFPTAAVPTPIAAPTPTPTMPSSRRAFIAGAAGAILSGSTTLLSMIFSGVGFMLIFYIGYGYYDGPLTVLRDIPATMTFAVGLILAGIGYLGLRRSYGSATGAVGFAFSIIVCMFTFFTMTFAIAYIIFEETHPWWMYNPYEVIYFILALVTLILFGVMQVLWGVAHIKTKKHMGNPSLAKGTGIILILSGAFTMSPLIFVGIILFYTGEILAAILFSMPIIPQQKTQTP